MTDTLQQRAPSEDQPLREPEPNLLDRVRAGSATALDQLFRENLPIGIMRAHFYVRNRDLAEEIATETFVRVYDAMTRGLGPHFTFRGYYLAAIHNAVAQRSRSAAVRTEMATGQVEIYAPPVYDNDECVRTESVRAVLAAMPKRWSTALQLSGIEGQSPQQLGSVLGLSPSAAAALTYRARNAFRRAYLTLDAERRKELG